MSGSGINWVICKCAPCSRQITTPTPHHSVFYRPDALPATQPTASKHWRLKALKERSWHVMKKASRLLVSTESKTHISDAYFKTDTSYLHGQNWMQMVSVSEQDRHPQMAPCAVQNGAPVDWINWNMPRRTVSLACSLYTSSLQCSSASLQLSSVILWSNATP